MKVLPCYVWLVRRSGLEAAARDKILGGNASAFLALEKEAGARVP
jgi:hypothetical protein